MIQKRAFPLILLITYALITFKVLVLKEMPDIRIGYIRFNFGGTHEGVPNLIPFKTIWPYLRGDAGWVIGGINLLGNIGLLVPFGFLLRFVFQNMTWKSVVAWSICTGFVIEESQVLLHVGIFDIDDVILNALGVVVGYWLQGLFVRQFQTITSRVIALGVIALVGIGTVYFGALAIQGGNEPHRPRPDVHVDLPDSGATGKRDDVGKLPDPCRGTGGTGRIVSIGAESITIRSKNGREQVIHLTSSTRFESPTGVASATELKLGSGVTIVTTNDTGDRLTAAAVLICGGQ